MSCDTFLRQISFELDLLLNKGIADNDIPYWHFKGNGDACEDQLNVDDDLENDNLEW